MTTYAEVDMQERSSYLTLGCLERECVVKRCAAGGLVGGIAFALFQMITAWLLGGYPFAPVKMVAAMLLSPDAVNPWFSYGSSVTVGFIIHFLLSVAFGAVFGTITAFVPKIATTRRDFIAAASTFGFFLWIINYYVIGMVVGWSWFAEDTHPIVQGFLAHTFFYGAVLGWYASKPQAPAKEYYD